MAEDQEEKTEQATDARREEFRKRGQVAMTRELGTALFFLAAAGLMYVAGKFFLQNFIEIFDRTMGGEFITKVRQGELKDIFAFVSLKIVILLAPVMLIATVLGVVSQIVQTGFLQVEDALSPNIEKLNPLKSLGRIFSMRGLADLLKSFLKMLAIGIVMYLLLKNEIRQIPYLTGWSMEQIFSYFGAVVYKLLFGTGMFMLVLAAADYFFQRWQLEKEMMMTKQEIKEEMKSRDGEIGRAHV